MSIPEILEPWVADPKIHAPTTVVPPCFIDFRAIDDLALYHPGFGVPLTFLHVAAQDADGPYARADALSNDWHEEMATVVRALKLRPAFVSKHAVLVDEAIGLIDTPDMHGWKVVRWTVVKSLDACGVPVHQDLIDWQGKGLLVQSMFSWRPYPRAPAKTSVKGMMANDRAADVSLTLR